LKQLCTVLTDVVHLARAATGGGVHAGAARVGVRLPGMCGGNEMFGFAQLESHVADKISPETEAFEKG
jgi:hypothetical protein